MKALPAAEGSFVRVQGVDVHVVDVAPDAPDSNAPPVVLIHGKGGSTSDFTMSPLLALLRRRHRVVVVDRPGNGFTYQQRGRIIHIREQARLVQAVVEVLGMEHPIMVGHSLGGFLSLNHALLFPGQTRGYVLISPFAYDEPWVSVATHLARSPALGGLMKGIFYSQMKLYAGPGRQMTARLKGTSKDYVDVAFAKLLQPEQFDAEYRNLLTVGHAVQEVCHRYPEIEAPVHIVSGDADRIVNFNRHSKRLSTALPNVRLTILPGVGHMVQMRAPQVLVDAVRGLERPASTQGSATRQAVRGLERPASTQGSATRQDEEKTVEALRRVPGR